MNTSHQVTVSEDKQAVNIKGDDAVEAGLEDGEALSGHNSV